MSNKKKKNKDNQSTKTSQNKKAKNKTTTETIDQNHKKSLKEEEKSEQPKSNINNTEKNKNQQNNNSSISDTQNNNKSASSPPVNNLTRSCDSSNGSDVDVIILQSRQVAVQGNQMAQTGDYHGAVKMFSKAIQLDPSDFRYTFFFWKDAKSLNLLIVINSAGTSRTLTFLLDFWLCFQDPINSALSLTFVCMNIYKTVSSETFHGVFLNFSMKLMGYNFFVKNRVPIYI